MARADRDALLHPSQIQIRRRPLDDDLHLFGEDLDHLAIAFGDLGGLAVVIPHRRVILVTLVQVPVPFGLNHTGYALEPPVHPQVGTGHVVEQDACQAVTLLGGAQRSDGDLAHQGHRHQMTRDLFGRQASHDHGHADFFFDAGLDVLVHPDVRRPFIQTSQLNQLDCFGFLVAVAIDGRDVLDVHAPYRHHEAQAQGHGHQVHVVGLDVGTGTVVPTTLVELLELFADVARDVRANLIDEGPQLRITDHAVQFLDHPLDLSADEEGGTDFLGGQVIVHPLVDAPQAVVIFFRQGLQEFVGLLEQHVAIDDSRRVVATCGQQKLFTLVLKPEHRDALA
ncbi:hypothetical protein D3C78_759870 [compost metagenome]